MKRGKNYDNAAKLVTEGEIYTPLQAVRLAKKTSTVKFDASVQVSMRLGVDPRKADQMVRGTVNLPHGTGKTARVLVFATGELAEQARQAGADFVGDDDMIEKVSGGWTDFDAAVATPDITGGKIEFRVDRNSNLNFIIGKVSFDESALAENYAAALDEVLRAKPSSSKGRYISKVVMSTSMGPGIAVDPNRTRNVTVDESDN